MAWGWPEGGLGEYWGRPEGGLGVVWGGLGWSGGGLRYTYTQLMAELLAAALAAGQGLEHRDPTS